MDIFKLNQNTKPHPLVFRFRGAEVSLEELSILGSSEKPPIPRAPKVTRGASLAVRGGPGTGHRTRDPSDGGGGGGGGRKLSTN